MSGTSESGRRKGGEKTGGRVVGSVTVQSQEVKNAILRVFLAANADDQYLETIAQDDKKLFLSLVARILPSEVSIDQTVSLDLGAAMRAASERVAKMNAEFIAHDPAPLIDVTPVTATPQPEPLEPRLRAATPAPAARATPAVDGGNDWPGYE